MCWSLPQPTSPLAWVCPSGSGTDEILNVKYFVLVVTYLWWLVLTGKEVRISSVNLYCGFYVLAAAFTVDHKGLGGTLQCISNVHAVDLSTSQISLIGSILAMWMSITFFDVINTFSTGALKISWRAHFIYALQILSRHTNFSIFISLIGQNFEVETWRCNSWHFWACVSALVGIFLPFFAQLSGI